VAKAFSGSSIQSGHALDLCAPDLVGSSLEKSQNLKVKIKGLEVHDCLRLKGEEGLSEPFLISLALRVEKEVKIPETLIGCEASVTVLGLKKPGDRSPSVPLLPFHGLIASLRELEEPDFKVKGESLQLKSLHLDLRPRFWFLKFTKDSRTFQDKTALDIVKELLKEHRVDVKDLCREKGKKRRVFCVQYRESIFDFMSRLLEEEGIGYFFAFDEKKHTLTLFDKNEACPQFKESLIYKKSAQLSNLSDEKSLWSFAKVMTPCPSIFSSKDYFYETPTQALYTQQPSKEKMPLKLDFYEYPGFFVDKKQGEDKTKQGIEAYEAESIRFLGQSTYLPLSAGSLIKPKGLQDKKLEKSYMITRITHFYGPAQENDTPSSGNLFEVIPSDVTYRPPKKHKRPLVEGPSIAIVTGKKGEEIWSDKEGRIKVRFYWDHRAKDDDTSSCWVRVLMGLAGPGFGTFQTPRVGQEVVVQFEEGDPERPLVVGALYNGMNKPPVTDVNHKQLVFKTRSTPKGAKENFNEIRLNDEKGKELFNLQAEKDMQTLVKDHQLTTVQKGNLETTLESGDRILILKGQEGGTKGKGNDKLILEKGERTVTLKEGQLVTTLEKGDETRKLTKGTQTITIENGDQKLKISKGSREVTLGKDDKLTISGNWTIAVKGKLKLSAKAGIDMETSGALNMKCTNLAIKASAKGNIQAGAALSMKGGASTKIEGAMTEVKGSGLVKVQGGIIQLN